MKKTLISFAIAIVIVGAGLLLLWSGGDDTNSTANGDVKSSQDQVTNTTTMSDPTAQLAKLAASPVAVMTTNYGTMKIKFYTAEAPELSKNFIELAKAKYYDGLTFHRIIPSFVIQGGDPLGTGTGGHSYKGEGQGLADEPGALALKHIKGAVAWAKSSLPNSIGSQFYIAVDDISQLDGGYSVFGQVTEGMDVVDKIAAVETDATDKPVEPVRIETVTIEE